MENITFIEHFSIFLMVSVFSFFSAFVVLFFFNVKNGVNNKPVPFSFSTAFFFCCILWCFFFYQDFILNNILMFIVCLIGYLFCGFLFSSLVWYRFCLAKKEDFLKKKETSPKEYAEKFYKEDDYKPFPDENKNLILKWFCFWPFFASYMGFMDSLKVINITINKVVQFTSGYFQKISDKAWK